MYLRLKNRVVRRKFLVLIYTFLRKQNIEEFFFYYIYPIDI